jgi:hypothetical protein
VPVLFHAGRGLDPFAADVGRLLRRHPGAPLILAHCGIGDLHELAAATDGCPGLALDTSLWNPLDAQALVASVPPERLVLGSDAPYYTPHSTIAKLVLPLRRGGASDAQVRGALWGTAERFARGEGLPTLSEPLDPGVGRIPLGCLRAHEYLLQATALVWTKQADAIGVLPLAGRALRSVDRLEAALAAELLELAARTWPVDVAHAPRREVLALSWSTFRLIDYADALAVNTPP